MSVILFTLGMSIGGFAIGDFITETYRIWFSIDQEEYELTLSKFFNGNFNSKLVRKLAERIRSVEFPAFYHQNNGEKLILHLRKLNQILMQLDNLLIYEVDKVNERMLSVGLSYTFLTKKIPFEGNPLSGIMAKSETLINQAADVDELESVLMLLRAYLWSIDSAVDVLEGSCVKTAEKTAEIADQN